MLPDESFNAKDAFDTFTDALAVLLASMYLIVQILEWSLAS